MCELNPLIPITVFFITVFLGAIVFLMFIFYCKQQQTMLKLSMKKDKSNDYIQNHSRQTTENERPCPTVR